ncbi:receptor-like protein 33 [Salvia miltiorrhiza]|uniref:receptor-like protein 33 n=1 Tax=Salvia miltiorrhiza TaxID=226208 RepID=UPI0025ACB275|nr:receptor-like protein 33 [Salvia miltiorrhiza]
MVLMTSLVYGTIPRELFTAKIESIDLSTNLFEGSIPPNIEKSHNLTYLNLATNNLSSSIPSTIGNLHSLKTLILHSNSFIGQIPSSICNLTSLQFLHLSNNTLHGAIPKCLGHLSKSLQVLHLKENAFHGLIPPSFPNGCALESLDLNGNHLRGKLPQTLANCGKLQVLDVGNNRIQDEFPFWLQTLADLRVLVLSRNRFNGAVSPIDDDRAPFQKLQVLDISENKFNGSLPTRYLATFPAMMNARENVTEKRNWFSKYEESMVFVIKGTDQPVVRILTTFTAIDVSGNYFSGEIPECIGNLNSLRYLNMSRNGLTGKIPSSLGSVKALESLDLSSNRLSGEIPRQLTELNFLSALNLSGNDLVGEIPQSGGQFPTFDNSSYVWNSGLCGFPLTKKCGQIPTLTRDDQDEDEDESDFVDGFSWRPVALGYGCAFVIGVLMGCFVMKYGRPKWLLEPFFGVRKEIRKTKKWKVEVVEVVLGVDRGGASERRRCGEKAGGALAGETGAAAVPDLEKGRRQRSSCAVRRGDGGGTRCFQSKKEGDHAGLEETASGVAAAMAGWGSGVVAVWPRG